MKFQRRVVIICMLRDGARRGSFEAEWRMSTWFLLTPAIFRAAPHRLVTGPPHKGTLGSTLNNPQASTSMIRQ